MLRREARHGRDQHLRVVVPRRRQQLARGADLHELAGPQHRHAVGDFRDHAEVVRDEQHAGAVLAHELADQREDLRLRRDVERRGRLVGDQQRGLEHQRHRDHDPLPLAAGELMRIRRHHPRRIGQLHRADDLEHFRAAFRRGERRVRREHLVDLVAAAHHRIQRRHRLLEDHRHARAAQRPQPRLVDGEQVLAGEQDFAVRSPCRPAGSRPIVACAMTLLPEPDSPTRHTISPGFTVKLTPVTAWMRSAPAGSAIRRSRTSRTGALTTVCSCADRARRAARRPAC